MSTHPQAEPFVGQSVLYVPASGENLPAKLPAIVIRERRVGRSDAKDEFRTELTVFLPDGSTAIRTNVRDLASWTVDGSKAAEAHFAEPGEV